MVEELKKYFDETPEEQIRADWEKIKELDLVGPTVEEYLNGVESMKKNQFAVDKFNKILENEIDSDVKIVEGFEFNFGEGVLQDTHSILFDGYGFTIGTYSETNELIVAELEYPEIENLMHYDLILISRHLGFVVDKTDVNIEDVASCFAELTEI